MVNELKDFIRFYDNVLPDNVCDLLVNLFDNNEDKHERVENQRKPNFTQFNLTENVKLSKETENIHRYIISKVFEYKKIYFEIVGEQFFPQKFNFEQFRIKKYKNDGSDAFDTHVDVQDYSSARRFLSFLWYLNDVNEGGETAFSSLKFNPKKRSMIIFPPMWMFPHSGLPPISNTKYIMSTYLHYI